MKKPLTQAQRLQAYMAASMYEVMLLLKWTKLEYCERQFNTGIAYLALTVPDEYDRRQVVQNAAFWGWWKLKWYQRDQQWLASGYMGIFQNGRMIYVSAFLPEPETPFAGVFQRRSLYVNIIHDAAQLAKGLEDSWCRDLVKELR